MTSFSSGSENEYFSQRDKQAQALTLVCDNLIALASQATDLTDNLHLPDLEAIEPLPWCPVAPQRSFVDHQQDFVALSQQLEGLRARIGEPVRVAFMGAFNAGKSTLINKLLACMLATTEEGLEAAAIKLKVSHVPTTKKFAVVLHPSQKQTDAIAGSSNVDPVEVDEDIFRYINLIDTPGTNEAPWRDQQVLEYMSHVDVILYLCPAISVLDENDQAALSVKADRLPDTPLVYVITHTDSLFFDKAGNLLEERVDETIDDFNVRIGNVLRGNASASFMRYRSNTFVVDSKTEYGIAELWDTVLHTFASPAANDSKLSVLSKQILRSGRDCERAFQAFYETGEAWRRFIADYQAHIFDHERTEVKRLVGDELRRSSWKIESRIRSVVGLEGTIDVESVFPRARDVEALAPSLDALLPGSFPNIAMARISTELRLLDEEIDDAGLQALFLDPVTFRLEFSKVRENWLAEAKKNVVGRRGVRDEFQRCDITGRVAREQFVSEKGNMICQTLGRRIERIVDLFVGQSDQSAIREFAAIVDHGFARTSTYYDEVTRAAIDWPGSYQKTSAEVHNCVPPTVADVLGDVVTSAVRVFKRQILDPLRAFRHFIDIQLLDAEKIEDSMRKMQHEVRERHNDALRNRERRQYQKCVTEMQALSAFVAERARQLAEDSAVHQKRLRTFERQADDQFNTMAVRAKREEADNGEFKEFLTKYTEHANALNNDLQSTHDSVLASFDESKAREQQRRSTSESKCSEGLGESERRLSDGVQHWDQWRNDQVGQANREYSSRLDTIRAQARTGFGRDLVLGVLLGAFVAGIVMFFVSRMPDSIIRNSVFPETDTLIDATNHDIDAVTITLTNAEDKTAEFLTVNTSGSHLTAEYEAASGRLTLSGEAQLAEYRSALGTVQYNNVAASRAAGDRIIQLEALKEGESVERIRTVISMPATGRTSYLMAVVVAILVFFGHLTHRLSTIHERRRIETRYAEEAQQSRLKWMEEKAAAEKERVRSKEQHEQTQSRANCQNAIENTKITERKTQRRTIDDAIATMRHHFSMFEEAVCHDITVENAERRKGVYDRFNDARFNLETTAESLQPLANELRSDLEDTFRAGITAVRDKTRSATDISFRRFGTGVATIPEETEKSLAPALAAEIEVILGVIEVGIGESQTANETMWAEFEGFWMQWRNTWPTLRKQLSVNTR